MSYVEGQAYRLLLNHQLLEDDGRCDNDDCTWWVRDLESMREEHAQHQAEELALAGLFTESKKSVATVKAEALYEIAESVCTCSWDLEYEDDFHTDGCPTLVITRKADRLR